MALLNWQPATWLRDLTAIAGTTLLTALPMPAGHASIGLSPSELMETEPAATTLSQLPASSLCPADLNAAVNTIVNRPQFASADWGILIEPLGAGTALYTHDADNMLIPASNVKLLTTAAAVHMIEARNPNALPQFQEQLEIINRYSNNAKADQLLKTIGGQHAVQVALSELGVSPEGYRQVDGSGLSRHNQATPVTFVTLLQSMYADDVSGMFYDSLPVGGVNGTLRNRFKDTPIAGKVHAKTGTLHGVRALSGYVETPAYGTVVFSIVVNQPGQSGSVMIGAIDEVVGTIARLQPCP